MRHSVLDNILTCNGLPCVVDDALMVFVRAVREVHANWTRASLGTRKRNIKGRDDGYEPMFTPAFLNSMSISTLFVFVPAYSQLSQRLSRYSRSTRANSPIVAMMLVYNTHPTKVLVSISRIDKGNTWENILTLRRYFVSSVGTAALTGESVDSHSMRDAIF